MTFRFLNRKQAKEIIGLIKGRWGADISEFLDAYFFVVTEKDKIYIVNREILNLDFKHLRINSTGLYFCKRKKNSVRLSIEGSQMAGPKAKKNVVEVSEENMKSWMRGEAIYVPYEEEGFVLIKYNEHFLGCGLAKDNVINNYVPKIRRVNL